FTALNKVYNATTEADIDAGGLNIVGLYHGDDVTIKTVGAKGVFADKNAGSGKKVTLVADGSGVLTGDDATNYVIDAGTAPTTTADITPATLVVDGTFTASSKSYDATTVAQINASGLGIVSGVIGGDDVSIRISGAE